MVWLRCLYWLLLLPLDGCFDRAPEFYAPPPQQAFIPAVKVERVTMIRMNDGDARRFIVRDVEAAPSGQDWGWSGPRPEFRFPLEKGKSYRAFLDFTIADATFEKTGPVTVALFVNGKPCGQRRYPKTGSYHQECHVSPDWITAGPDTLLAAEVQPVWVSPEDGARLGVILSRAGFLPE